MWLTTGGLRRQSEFRGDVGGRFECGLGYRREAFEAVRAARAEACGLDCPRAVSSSSHREILGSPSEGGIV
jgi:hypothetical protein